MIAAADLATGCRFEAFPASVSPTQRTTYLFTYMSLEKERPAVLDIMDDYWRKLPGYQGVDLDDLALQRVLFGLFVSYKESPLPCRFALTSAATPKLVASASAPCHI